MPQVITATARNRRWLRMVVCNLLLAVAIAILYIGVGFRTPWRQAAKAVATAFVFTMCIGALAAWALPRIAPAFWRRLRFPLNWIATAAAMVGFALAGGAMAVLVLMAIGLVPPADYWRWYVGTMRISIGASLAIGLFITALEVNRAQVAEATARAQLASLENRVQPHFLFNTLNSIASLTHEDAAGAERMTTQLAALLRSSLDADRAPLVTLGEELALVRSYLDIEKVRFGDRLRFAIDTAAVPTDVQVPRLAVQTLVENSVKYAVSPRREGATIRIRAEVANGRLLVEVGDDGPGFDGAALPEGHGLALLKARLALLFDRRASMTISREGGARVAIDLPC